MAQSSTQSSCKRNKLLAPTRNENWKKTSCSCTTYGWIVQTTAALTPKLVGVWKQQNDGIKHIDAKCKTKWWQTKICAKRNEAIGCWDQSNNNMNMFLGMASLQNKRRRKQQNKQHISFINFMGLKHRLCIIQIQHHEKWCILQKHATSSKIIASVKKVAALYRWHQYKNNSLWRSGDTASRENGRPWTSQGAVSHRIQQTSWSTQTAPQLPGNAQGYRNNVRNGWSPP